ncbi:hypothetical protein GGQ85_004328 [Nitrobacter vulgaris]|uniref:hypothetical protein n=1 Tax=Nitrobacter vulgaris TaxID=29421 RepID=UPI00285F5C1A|nr:hypothetical protein [Nitrobacter vulgaris]MDR6306595.1 hypothetical protein [Nitrobacter vulgaris]
MTIRLRTAIGSISKKNHRVEHRDFWAWEIDTMPMMSHGGQPPYGEARNFDQAKNYSGKPLKNGEVAYRRRSLRRT